MRIFYSVRELRKILLEKFMDETFDHRRLIKNPNITNVPLDGGEGDVDIDGIEITIEEKPDGSE